MTSVGAPIGPGREALERILVQAMRAPSAGNAQPWSFTWDGRCLAIHLDEDRVPLADAQLSWLELGVLVEALSLSASSEGLAIVVTRVQPVAPDGPRLQLRFAASVGAPDPLAARQQERFTDRRLYAEGALDPRVREGLARDFGLGAVGLHLVDGCPGALREHLARWEAFWVEWPRLTHATLLRWTRWSRREAERLGDGSHYRSLGMGYPLSRALKLVQAHPSLHGVLRGLGGARGMSEGASRRLRASAGVALVATRDRSPDSALLAGRRFLRTWLTLQEAGCSLQPMGLSPSCLAVHASGGAIPDDAPRALRELLPVSAAVFADHFGLEPGEAPAFLFRFGRSPGPPPRAQRTLRRSLADTLRMTPPHAA